ncbi:MAG TPA: hypothetical protein VJR92_06420, partial [Gemmatimonadaceae bacterium]|nr:hypothetical protein [Gemmatimonadaceae bacterium]
MRNQIRSFALVAAAVVIAACGGDGATSTQEPEPEPELAFTAALPNGVAGNALTAIQVRVVDENGDVITTSTAPVTIAITAGTGADGATLTGVLTRNAVAGVATFDGLTIVKAGDDFKLTATSNDIPSATSGTFDIVHNTPDRLRVVTSPGLSMAGQPLAPAFVVRVEDAYGNIATNATNNVTVSLAGGSLSAQIGGTVTKAPLNGIVSFDNVTIDRSGAAYLVTASAPGLSNAPSAAFNVQISLRFVNELTNGLAGFETGNTVMIEAQDPIGTPLTARAVSMTATGGGAVFQIAPSPNTDPQG